MKYAKYFLSTAGLILVFVIYASVVKAKSKDIREDQFDKVAKYRFQNVVRDDVGKQVAELEAKVAKSHDSIDMSILAGLYFAQSRLTGDLSWLDKAEASAKQSLASMPTRNSTSKLVLAKIAESRHDFKTGIKIASEAYHDDSSKVSALGVLGTSYLATGDLIEGGKIADQFVDRMPSLQSYGLRALFMEAQGRDEEAKNDFSRALQIEDVGESQESARVRSLYARYLMRHGDFTRAQTLLDEALKTIPNYHLALDLKGELEMRKGEYSNAETDFKAAFDSSKQLAYLVHLARLKTLMGNKQLAEEIQSQAELLLRADIAKNGIGHRLDLAMLLLDRGRANDLKEALTLASEDYKNRASALPLGVLAEAQLRSKDLLAARTSIRDLLRIGVREPEYYEEAARIEAAVDNPRMTDFYHHESMKLTGGRELPNMVAMK